MEFQVEKEGAMGSQSTAHNSAPAPPSGAEKLILSYHRGTETILVVDDEEAMRAIMADFLGQLGYNILSAAEGQQALRMAEEYSGIIHLLLTDITMDGMSGPELAEALLKKRPAVKVVFVSGFPEGSVAPDGVLKPGTVLLQKPFTIKLLSAKLREVLGPSPNN
jgi:two-component system, cell cycle sensor histidine kinase and response regulator CckA